MKTGHLPMTPKQKIKIDGMAARLGLNYQAMQAIWRNAHEERGHEHRSRLVASSVIWKLENLTESDSL